MSDRLARYLTAAARGGRGWVIEYEDGIAASGYDGRWAILAGHYHGLLEDLIDLCGGLDAVMELCEARRRWRRRVRERWETDDER